MQNFPYELDSLPSIKIGDVTLIKGIASHSWSISLTTI